MPFLPPTPNTSPVSAYGKQTSYYLSNLKTLLRLSPMVHKLQSSLLFIVELNTLKNKCILHLYYQLNSDSFMWELNKKETNM